MGEQLLAAFLNSRFWESLVPGLNDGKSLCIQSLGKTEDNEEPGRMRNTVDNGESGRMGDTEDNGEPGRMGDTEDIGEPGRMEDMEDNEEPGRMGDTEDNGESGKTEDFRAEEKAALFYRAGLLKDELSNHVLVYGISGAEKHGRPHKGILGYLEQREPLHLSLMTLGKLARVSPQTGKRVYIVENPAVFAVLAKAWPDAAIVCGNGQTRLATLVLLDLFGSDTEFWYAGDYDPEGLLIAQRLKERYRERLHFWQYRREFYEKYRSDVEISDRSIKKLDRVYREELQDIKQAMKRQKKAAYQEAMLGEYLGDR